MAVNFVTIYGSEVTIYGRAVTIYGNFITINVRIEKVKDTIPTINVRIEKVNGNFIIKNVKSIKNFVDLKFHLPCIPKMTGRINPLQGFDVKAHFAGAKLQRHLQKELVL